MARRQPLDVPVERGFFIFPVQLLHQEIDHPGFVQAAADRFQRENRANLGTKCEQRSRAMIVKRSDPDMIPGTEQLLLACVPDGEGKIAKKPVGTIFAPALVSAEDQLSVSGIPAGKPL